MAESELKQLLQEQEERVTKRIDEKAVETQRHFDVVAEDLKSDIQTVAEQVASNTEKLVEHDAKFEAIQSTLGNVETNIEFIKHELKQKVDRDEFAALERRVANVETKLRSA